MVIAMERRLRSILCTRQIPHRWFISYSMLWLFSDLKPVTHKRSEKSLLENFYACVEAASQKPAPKADMRLPVSAEDELEALRLLPDIGKKYVAQVPGAGDKAKCWSLEKHIELAKKLYETGHMPVFILGPAEYEWEELLKQAVPFAKFPLQETQRESSIFLTAAISSRLDAAVTNDCGTAHILAAGIVQEKESAPLPIITLFGKTNAKKNAPFTKRAIVITASDFVKGSKNIDDIPFNAVFNAVIEQLGEVKVKTSF
ncbi:MAG: lipopolysaccharide heptosyltransferase family protein [Alphaproteobacteria bacterium]|nr:lipopolysaccharide heptosyltransferase family protein [Alphaproteobacteria bacterium]